MALVPRVAALGAILLLFSCAAVSHRFTCPARGGAEWRELRSEHVLLQTDLSGSQAEELLRDAEHMRALILAALFKQPPQLPDRIHLVAFRTDRELWEFTGDAGPGDHLATYGFSVDRRSADPLLAVAPAWGKYRNTYLAQLTHVITWQLTSYLFPGQPAWYRVGLATYMETLAYDDDGRRFVGRVPPDIFFPPWEVPGALSKALTGSSGSIPDVILRSQAWLLVRWLSEVRPAEYLAFLKRISAGQDGPSAWLAVFPDWNPADPGQMARLEAELTAFCALGMLRYREVTASVTPTVSWRTFDPSEVHELRVHLLKGAASLRAMNGPERAKTKEGWAAILAKLELETARQVEQETLEALTDSPLHPASLRLAVSEEKTLDPARARASTDAHPKDWRAWLLLGDALRKGEAEGARAAYRKVAELGAGEPVAQLGIASGLLTLGDAEAALAAAREAARLAPFSDEALAVQATSAARTGACAEALRLSQRLRARLAEEGDGRLESMVADIFTRCPEGKAGDATTGAAARSGSN